VFLNYLMKNECPRIWISLMTHFHQKLSDRRFQVFMAVSVKMAVFWFVAPCSLVEVYWCFRGVFCHDHWCDDCQQPRRQSSLLERSFCLCAICITRQQQMVYCILLHTNGLNLAKKHCVFFLQEQCHGVKRSGSYSWEGELHKASKHPHVEVGKEFNPEICGSGGVNQCHGVGKQYSSLQSMPPQYQAGANVNLWPPFSVSVTPLQQTAPCSTHGLVNYGSLFRVICKVSKHKCSSRPGCSQG
jgi:hypothetical protein